MTLSFALAILVVVVAAPLNWLVTIWLWSLTRSAPDIYPLRERAVGALALAIIVSIFSLVFLNNEQPIPPLDLEATRVLTRSALLVCSVIPAAYWLRMYRRS